MAKKQDPITRFTLKCDENGVWYAHDNWYPYIGHPGSWGAKERAQNYIAGELGITWKEYQSIKNGKSMRNEPKEG